MIPTLLMAAAPLADTWHMHDGDDWWAGMWIAMVVFWIAVIALAAWAIRGGILHARPHPRESPLEALDRSLAEGRISPQDYRERRALLTGEPPLPGAGGDQAAG